MADFITTKANGDSLDASEWNQLEEIDNAIDSSGLTLTTAQKDQLKISMARYASGANFYTDGGSANAYVLTSISHGGGKSFAPAGAGAVNYFNGMSVRFRPANNNSGASTVNVSGFGSKDIRKSNGTSALTGGELTTATDVILRYDSTNSCFIIQEYAKATTTNQGVSYLSNPITIANNATDANNDIDFSAGNATLDDGSGQVLLSSTLVKRLDASWVAGTNQGGLFSGTKANSTKYYLFAITNGTINDAGFDISPTGANIPSGYKGSYRLMIKTDSSGNILAFKQNRNKILLTSPITEYSGTVGATYTNLTSSNVPLKDNIEAIVNLYLDVPTSETNGRAIIFKDLVSGQQKQTIIAKSTSTTVLFAVISDVIIALNSSGQFQYKSTDATTGADILTTGTFQIKLNGWVDNNIK